MVGGPGETRAPPRMVHEQVYGGPAKDGPLCGPRILQRVVAPGRYGVWVSELYEVVWAGGRIRGRVLRPLPPAAKYERRAQNQQRPRYVRVEAARPNLRTEPRRTTPPGRQRPPYTFRRHEPHRPQISRSAGGGGGVTEWSGSQEPSRSRASLSRPRAPPAVRRGAASRVYGRLPPWPIRYDMQWRRRFPSAAA